MQEGAPSCMKEEYTQQTTRRRHIYTRVTHCQCRSLEEYSIRIEDGNGGRFEGASGKAVQVVMVVQ
jgi:hypothetical protein